MPSPTMSKKKADAISNGVFLVCLGILFFTNGWWPGILLALWITLSIRQLLTGRVYDCCISTILFVGLFLVAVFQLQWAVIVPVLLISGGLFFIFREYWIAKGIDAEDPIEETEKEIEDGK